MHRNGLITIASLARFLGCAPERARELIAAKRVSVCAIGKTVTVSTKEIGRLFCK
jgi:hypothetical protein